MDKQNIKRTFSKHGDFMTVTQIAEAMNLDRGTVRGLLNGVAYIPVGRKKLYHVADVTECLWARRVTE